jgi:ATP phosphoribosyltransferase
MSELLDLGCRPASILAAFPHSYGVRTSADVLKFFSDVASHNDNGRATVATEFPNMTKYALVQFFGVPEDLFTLRETDGKTENYASPDVRDADAMVDVSETGSGILRNQLRAVRPEILRPTKPRLIIHTDAYSAHEPVVNELVYRLQKGIDDLREYTNGEAFREKLPEEVFA